MNLGSADPSSAPAASSPAPGVVQQAPPTDTRPGAALPVASDPHSAPFGPASMDHHPAVPENLPTSREAGEPIQKVQRVDQPPPDAPPDGGGAPAPAVPVADGGVARTPDASNGRSSSGSSSRSSSSSSSSDEGRAAVPRLNATMLRFESAAQAVQGARPSMEDAHLIAEGLRGKDDMLCCMYAVYDGHGGPRVAKIAAESLHDFVLSNPAFVEGRIEEAIRAAYHRVDESLLERATAEKWKDGSTGVLTLVYNRRLYVSNVGDSEAVLARRRPDGSGLAAVLLTDKHLPTVPSEKARIEALGGFVFKGRVFGTLAVSRALGDYGLKNPNYVSVDPTISSLDLTSDDRFMVVACDGLWDKVTYAEAVDLVDAHRRQGCRPQEICDMLVKEALRRNSLDNITVLLVFFEWE